MKKILILLVLLLSSAALMAEPIGEQRARQIAEEFFAQYGTRSTDNTLLLEWAGDEMVKDAATGSDLSASLMYIYNRGKNEGFVVVAGDSNIAPIIAYSFDTCIDTSNMADATRAILDAWCKQVASARKVARPVSSGMPSIATRSTDELLYDTAIWDQSAPYNWEAPIYDGYRCVTGCVATAMSIICYYNKWPKKGTGTTPAYSYEDSYGTYRTVAANELGRSYDYNTMLKDYNNGYTNAQGNAVAALMKDMGTSVKMMYHYTSSGAFDSDVLLAFTNYFSYSKSAKFGYPAGYTTDEWNDILRNNLRDCGPTYYSGQSASGGHAFIVDGFNGDYFHFNFGWGGYGNGYFLYPEIKYYAGQTALLCLKPDKDGTSTYTDELCLTPLYSNGEQVFYGISTDATSYDNGSSFNSLLGGIYNNGVTTFNGDITLVLCDKEGQWKQELAGFVSYSIEPSRFIYDYMPCQIDNIVTLEEGDRLRLYYKGKYSNDWQWMRSMDRSNCYDELVLRPTAEEIARNLTFQYNKNSMEITYYLPYAHNLTIRDASTSAVVTSHSDTAHSATSIDLSEKADNGITDILDLTFSVADESYTLRMKF